MVLFSEQCAFNNSVNSGNMKQRNSLTSNNKQTGRWPADMLDIYKLIYLIWPVWSLQQDWKISNEGPFFRFSWDRQKLLVALPRWRSLCHSLARDQPQPGSFFQRPREAEKRDPGSEVGQRSRFLVLTKRSAASGDENGAIAWPFPVMLFLGFQMFSDTDLVAGRKDVLLHSNRKRKAAIYVTCNPAQRRRSV